MAGRITAVRRSHRHYSFEAVAPSLVAVDVEKWRINAQLIARQTGQSLNVKRRSGDWIRTNRRNIICPEDKNIAVVRLNQVVAAFVDKDLVARVERASGYNFAAMTNSAGKDIKILTKRVGRGVYKEILPLTYEPRKSKKEGHFLWHDLGNLVILSRNHVDVIATQKHEFHDLSQKIWLRLGARMTDNSVQRRLHRTGGNFERLKKIGANPHRDHDCDQNHFAVLSPMRFPGHRCEFVERLIKCLR